MMNDPRSYDRNFCNCVKKPEKNFRTSTGFEPVTSRYRCDALPNELWSHWRWEQVNFGFICSRERYEGEWCIWNKSHVNCGYEIKWRTSGTELTENTNFQGTVGLTLSRIWRNKAILDRLPSIRSSGRELRARHSLTGGDCFSQTIRWNLFFKSSEENKSKIGNFVFNEYSSP